MSAAATTYDVAGYPRVTLERDEDGNLSATIEIEGLDAQRGVSAEERIAGISSIDPPTVSARARDDRAKTLRVLIDAAIRAVWAAAESTTGQTGGAGGLVLSGWKVAVAMRQSLRAIDEDI